MRCEKPEPLDCGAEPTCCKRCTHKYQEHFNKDEHFPLLCQETNCCHGAAQQSVQFPNKACCIVIFLLGMTKEPQLRDGLLVKRRFARILRKSPRQGKDINRKKSKGFYFWESYLHAVDTEMKFIANKNEDRLKWNQICAWIHIIKSLTNFASKCSKIHAALQRLFWSVGTECIVVALWYSFGKLCSIWCGLFWATPQSSEPRVKKRKMSRHSTKKKAAHLTS